MGIPLKPPITPRKSGAGLIDKVRSRFSGQLFFALPYSSTLDESYDFLKEVDAIYVEMDAALTTSDSPSLTELKSSVSGILDSNVYQLYAAYQKPIIIGMDYASVDGSAANCLNFSSSCRDYLRSETNPLSSVDLEEQALIYQAIIEEAIQRNWGLRPGIRGIQPQRSGRGSLRINLRQTRRGRPLALFRLAGEIARVFRSISIPVCFDRLSIRVFSFYPFTNFARLPNSLCRSSMSFVMLLDIMKENKPHMIQALMQMISMAEPRGLGSLERRNESASMPVIRGVPVQRRWTQ